jgi:phosphatidylserine/phosphatidylglycerophosphate/cardiolipin synthase-like enzyme
MKRVRIKPYLSPSLVLLALDWEDGAGREDFLGFAIRRSPGFGSERQSWLPNRIGFDGPARRGDFPSDEAPIQKFQWWDARIDEDDRGRRFTYTAWPVVGRPGALRRLESASAKLTVTLPRPVEDGIGTWFNRAVVSSQAFSRKFLRGDRRRALTGKRLQDALDWLGNGMEDVVPEFLGSAEPVEGAIYHLTDKTWIVPAFRSRSAETSLVYDATTRKDGGAEANAEAVKALRRRVDLRPRTKAKIMHDKFLVRGADGEPEALLMGSANFSTDALTTQANLLHTFESPELAKLYLARKELLEADPTLAATRRESGWSRPVEVSDARVRVFFPPEPTDGRESIETIVRAVEKARSSVVFCIFTPTDAGLRQALFDAGDRGRMMFGLINQISKPKEGARRDAGYVARVETYNRSRKNKDVYAHSAFTDRAQDHGFWFEVASIPGRKKKDFPVFIHHKFVVIDAETDSPTIYTGSANMSGGSLHHNDENLLEIKGRPALAHVYLAEFMRLYEHYRARAKEVKDEPPTGGRVQASGPPCRKGFALAHTACWAEDDYTKGTPQYKSRLAMTD